MAADDQFFTPIHIVDLLAVLKRCIQKKIRGLLNVGGMETINRFDLAKHISHLFHDSRGKLVRIQLDNLPGAKRPKNTSLDCTKLFQTVSSEFTTLKQSIQTLHDQYTNRSCRIGY